MMAEAVHPCCNSKLPCPIWEGSPRGHIVDIDGIETYIARPESHHTQKPSQSVATPQRVILFLTEGHGIYLPNAQLLADSFASQLGCDVIMPDQFATKEPHLEACYVPDPESQSHVPWTEDKDDPNYENRGLAVPSTINLKTSDVWPFVKPPSWHENSTSHFEQWKQRHEPVSTDPILASVIQHIRVSYGDDTKIGGVGYCFGGRYILRLMGSGTIDVGVVNHPSFFSMEEVEAVKQGQKLAMYAAEIDDILPAGKRRQTEDLLGRGGVIWQSMVFGGTEHGFSVRGDLNVKQVKLAKEAAFRGAVEWFQAWL